LLEVPAACGYIRRRVIRRIAEILLLRQRQAGKCPALPGILISASKPFEDTRDMPGEQNGKTGGRLEGAEAADGVHFYSPSFEFMRAVSHRRALSMFI